MIGNPTRVRVLVAIGLLLGVGAAFPADSSAGSWFSMQSQPGDYIGQGSSWGPYVHGQNATITATGSGNSVHVSIQGVAWWTADFAAPSGQQLAVGTYVDAQRYPFHPPGRPGLSVSGDGRGCNRLSGRFTITDLAFGPNNTVRRLRATFVQFCEYTLSALAGEVAFNVDAPPAAAAAPPPLPGNTWLALSSQPGDYIGQGRSWGPYVFLENAKFSASYSRSAVRISADSGPEWWYVELSAPEGLALTPGTYEGAMRSAFRPLGAPGIDVSGTGRGCNTITGRFVVTDAAFKDTGEVERFHATFEQHCEGAVPALFGEVAIMATPRPTECLGSRATIIGTPQADTLTGTSGADVIAAMGGEDTISGLSGNDKICGGQGADTLDFSAAPGPITLNMLAAVPATATGQGTDTVSEIENLTGSRYADQLVGDAGPNTLLGGGGADDLRGAAGNDTLQGGNDNDFLRGNLGNDTVVGGPGTDTLDYANAEGPIILNMLAAVPATATGQGTDTVSEIENLTGSPYADQLVGDGGPNTLLGVGGADDLRGAAGNDIVQGGAENDFLRGNLGNDTVVGGAGTDMLDYANAEGPIVLNMLVSVPATATGQGTDTVSEVENLTGSPYADQLVGDGGPNTLLGVGGADDLRGAAGNDIVQGGADNDFLRGNPGDDTLTGGTGTDTADFANATAGITANLTTKTATGQGSDQINETENVVGSPYRDLITGNELANLLNGGPGDDDLDGQAGTDTCIQGPGTGLITRCEA